MKKIIEIQLSQLLINGENKRIAPTIANSLENENKIIKAHLELEENSENQYMELITSIVDAKEVLEPIYVVWVSHLDKFIVVEGNRRIIACKILSNNDLMPNRSFELNRLSKKIDLNMKIPARNFGSYEQALKAADLTNPASNDGSRKTGWNPLTDLYHNNLKEAGIFLRFILDKCGFSFKQIKSCGLSKESFEKIFNKSNLKSLGVEIKNKVISDQQIGNVQQKMNKILNSGHKLNVSFARNKDLMSKFFGESNKKIKSKKVRNYTTFNPSDLKKVPSNTKLHEIMYQTAATLLHENNYYLVGASVRACAEIFLSSLNVNAKNQKASLKEKSSIAFKKYFPKPSQTEKSLHLNFQNNIIHMHNFLHNFEQRLGFGESKEIINKFVDYIKKYLRVELDFIYE